MVEILNFTICMFYNVFYILEKKKAYIQENIHSLIFLKQVKSQDSHETVGEHKGSECEGTATEIPFTPALGGNKASVKAAKLCQSEERWLNTDEVEPFK